MANEDFSVRLKKGLNIRNMKPIELAEKLGINRGIISQYLSGRYKPNHHRFYDIAKALNVSEAWLLGFDVPIDDDDSDEVDKLYNNNRKILTKDDKTIIKSIITNRLNERNGSNEHES